ncbi:MAG: helix-turn-helix domain-containing protein, partial [Pirellulales bacterium]
QIAPAGQRRVALAPPEALRVVEIVVPPLRHRPGDIVTLADYFLHRLTEETGRRIRRFTPEALEQLTRYRWPGNVRELKNVVERAVVLCGAEEIGPGDLLLSNLATAGDTSEVDLKRLGGQGKDVGFDPCSLSELEKQHILSTLEHTGWNKSRTAAILGIERSTLDRKIHRYELAERQKT